VWDGRCRAVGFDQHACFAPDQNEFLALNKARERLAGSEEQTSGLEQRNRFVERRRLADPRSIESLLAEFEVVRSAIIRLVEQGAGNKAHYGTLAEICVARPTY